jgi:hypothetical protein
MDERSERSRLSRLSNLSQLHAWHSRVLNGGVDMEWKAQWWQDDRVRRRERALKLVSTVKPDMGN